MDYSVIEEIKRIKKEKNAVILAHNYQLMEVQNVADYTGDSLQLAILAANLDYDIIVFCGVKFMAETAKLLNPDSKVLLPVIDAGCPMADMITGEQLSDFKSHYENPWVICYVNSSVEVKAESDICCTSGNAVKLVENAPKDKTLLFVPDKNLGSYAAKITGRNVELWQGFCNVHNQISKDDVIKARKKYPDYTLTVHPECPPEVVAMADHVASTKGMIDYAAENDRVIIGTETGLLYQLKAKYPDKKLVPLCEETICYNMKKTKLSDVLNCLKDEKHEIIVPENIARRALKSVQRMISFK